MTPHAGVVVVGVDGSEESSSALVWAVENARPDAAIHVVHAFSPVAELALAAVQQDWLPQRQRIARELDKEWIADARAAGSTPYTSVVDADPTHALVSKAETCGAEMIVVGRHGSGGSRTPGRVARGLLHELPVPVVFARRDDSQVDLNDDSDEPQSGRVLMCVGYGQAAESALTWAARFAVDRGLSLELLHVVGYRPLAPLDSPSDMLASYLGGRTSVEWALSELEERAESTRHIHPELDIVCRVERGSVIRRIVERSKGAALVVLGQSHSEPLTRHLTASRTSGVITQTKTSVAVIPA